MKIAASSFVAGGLFGAGLLISQMTNPAKVIDFLNFFADPSLALVMASALLVTFLGYRFVLRSESPKLDDVFHLPTSQDIDAPLIGGGILFGVGWGLSGLCPGPALSSISFAGPNIVYFLAGMIGGIVLYRLIRKRA